MIQKNQPPVFLVVQKYLQKYNYKDIYKHIYKHIILNASRVLTSPPADIIPPPDSHPVRPSRSPPKEVAFSPSWV